MGLASSRDMDTTDTLPLNMNDSACNGMGEPEEETTEKDVVFEGDPEMGLYDLILINSSAGKDSQAMLTHLVKLADSEGVPREKLVVIHCDLGRVEWEGTAELAEEQAKFYGLRFIKVSRVQGDLLTQVEQRGMWPDSARRFCTSDHKRSQVYKALTGLVREIQAKVGKRPVLVLNCLGLRADESPARAKKHAYMTDSKASNGKRAIHTWLPIHGWTEEQVWETIKASGVRYHEAYGYGLPRLSCCFCVLASRDALLLAGHHNKALLDEYVAVEQRIGHTFKKSLPILQIKQAVEAGEMPKGRIRTWRMLGIPATPARDAPLCEMPSTKPH